MFAREQAERGLESDDAVHRRRADDRTVCFGSDADRSHEGGDGHCAAGARSARRAIEHIRIFGQSTDCAPAADGIVGAKVRPFAEICFAQNHCARRSQVRDDGRVTSRNVVDQGQRAGGGRHRIGGFDVVLEQHGDAVQRTARTAFVTQLLVECPRLRDRLGIHGNDCSQLRPLLVERCDSLGKCLDQRDRGGRTRVEITSQLAKRASFRRLRRGDGLQRGQEKQQQGQADLRRQMRSLRGAHCSRRLSVRVCARWWTSISVEPAA